MLTNQGLNIDAKKYCARKSGVAIWMQEEFGRVPGIDRERDDL